MSAVLKDHPRCAAIAKAIDGESSSSVGELDEGVNLYCCYRPLYTHRYL